MLYTRWLDIPSEGQVIQSVKIAEKLLTQVKKKILLCDFTLNMAPKYIRLGIESLV